MGENDLEVLEDVSDFTMGVGMGPLDPKKETY
jgi:hypothetical protein